MEKKIKVTSCDKDENLNGAIIIYEIMPGRPTKYVTEERLQEVVNEAVVSIRKDVVTHEELHRVVHQVVNDAINSLEERMTKLILSLKN
jgi:hypothetical protein